MGCDKATKPPQNPAPPPCKRRAQGTAELPAGQSQGIQHEAKTSLASCICIDRSQNVAMGHQWGAPRPEGPGAPHKRLQNATSTGEPHWTSGTAREDERRHGESIGVLTELDHSEVCGAVCNTPNVMQICSRKPKAGRI